MLICQPGAQRFDRARLAEAVQHHRATLGGKSGGDSKPDTARRPGDDCHFTFQHEISPHITIAEAMPAPRVSYYTPACLRQRGKMVYRKARATHDLSQDTRHYP